jgi:hypothetical protein
MEQEDRFIDEEGPLDEDNRFRPFAWEEGQCKECHVGLSKASKWWCGEEFFYCTNQEGCSQGEEEGKYDPPSKKLYDETVDRLLEKEKECFELSASLDRAADRKEFSQRRYKRLLRYIQDSGMTVKELIHRGVNKQ